MNKKEIEDIECNYMVSYKLNTAAILRFKRNEVRTHKMLLKWLSGAMSERFDAWLPRMKYGAKLGTRTGSNDQPYMPLKLIARYVATSDRLYKEKLAMNDPKVGK